MKFRHVDASIPGEGSVSRQLPSQLKAWIDRLAVAGKTFRYAERGPQGLAGGKKVMVASSRGGFHGPDSPAATLDHQETYLRGIFGFFGVTDITFVRAEGVNVSEDHRKASIAAATAEAARPAA